MNRRNFLTGAAALLGGIALEQAIPFNRVWSFPKDIVIPKSFDFAPMDLIRYNGEIFRVIEVYTTKFSYGRVERTLTVHKFDENIYKQIFEVLNQ